MRKPPGKVSAIRGQHKPDLITQDELKDLENLQRMQWTIDKRAALMSERIKVRISEGATVADGPLYFDQELEIVRSRQKPMGKTEREKRVGEK